MAAPRPGVCMPAGGVVVGSPFLGCLPCRSAPFVSAPQAMPAPLRPGSGPWLRVHMAAQPGGNLVSPQVGLMFNGATGPALAAACAASPRSSVASMRTVWVPSELTPHVTPRGSLRSTAVTQQVRNAWGGSGQRTGPVPERTSRTAARSPSPLLPSRPRSLSPGPAHDGSDDASGLAAALGKLFAGKLPQSNEAELDITSVQAQLNMALEAARSAAHSGQTAHTSDAYLVSAGLKWRLWNLENSGVRPAASPADPSSACAIPGFASLVALPGGVGKFVADLLVEADVVAAEAKQNATALAMAEEKLLFLEKRLNFLERSAHVAQENTVVRDVYRDHTGDSERELAELQKLCQMLTENLSRMHRAHSDSIEDALGLCQEKDASLQALQEFELKLEWLGSENMRLRKTLASQAPLFSAHAARSGRTTVPNTRWSATALGCRDQEARDTERAAAAPARRRRAGSLQAPPHAAGTQGRLAASRSG
eukprot:CAMPEP_0204150924 /NCGR_PEP_ID=MMETSP0361-20130328/25709_1 /ASSEMBLY_ACC=CAM_ASM_000343 /TAXON_ID=268821 /ORGANISM="Scrippsiella Hangoei, Strain SHTV-5" /LENGTH=480 /DNA_ID=CAMNT_0051105667 /DNA_START=18 /DNA_END=1456 /DNA_ORIENTATION=+